MRTLVLIAALATALAGWLPWPADAKGGSMQPKRSKDFRELIVKGERPEIAACLVAAIDYARHHPDYDAIRWDDDASDRAIMKETESDGRLTRRIRLTAQLRLRGSSIFSETWRPQQISCVQSEDGAVQVNVTASGG